MANIEANIVYANVERNEAVVESNIYEVPDIHFSKSYELPEILHPEPKKDHSFQSQEVVNEQKGKRGHCFNIFITVLAVFLLLLALTTLVFFLVHYSSNQPLETQQNTDIEALKSLLNRSNEEVLTEISKLERAQLLIQTLQEQLNISNQQNEENVSELREQLNNSSQQNEGRILELQEQLSVSNQQNKAKVSNLQEQLNISNQQNEENVNELREQLNNSSQQNKEKVIKLQEAIQDYVQDLEQRQNDTDYEIQKLSSDLRGHVQSVEAEVEILKIIVRGRKVAEINMTDPTQQCPDGFKQINRTRPPLRTCGRPDGIGGCVSMTFPVNGIEYSRVRGRIVAYQIGTPSGFGSPLSDSIDSYYVAGISLTHGQPRQHIWSFANARGEGYTSEVCPLYRW